jgi:hypothetical protein
MKKLLFVPIALALFSLSACNKFKDLWDDHHGDDKDPRSYNITKWEVDGLTGIFTYDNHDNPLRVTFNETFTGLTNWTLQYDSQHRLKVVYQHYGDDLVQFHTRTTYEYDSNNRIVRDTVVYYHPDPASMHFVNTEYTYDAQGRMNHETIISGGNVLVEFDYTYDANGNLVRPNTAYDTKANVNLTNKIWQFLNRDYSINNPFPAVSYTSAKLPKQFNAPLSNPYAFKFLSRPYNVSTFTYQKK